MYSYAELDWAGDSGTRRVGRTEAEAEERMAKVENLLGQLGMEI